MKKEYIKSALDGIIQGLLPCFLSNFIMSVFFIEPIELNVIVLIVLGVISLISFYFLILRKAQKVWLKSIISFILFLAILILNFINLMTLHIQILPLREVSNANGLLLLFLVGSFLAYLVISRLVVLIIRFIIKKVKKS